MNRASFVAVLTLVCALAFIPLCSQACPELPERDPIAPFRATRAAAAAVVEYFTASKNADAKHAVSLIDYDEWAKLRGIPEAQAKQWAATHRRELKENYRREKAAGSTKEFKIVMSRVGPQRATFHVTQDRALGVYLWEVELMLKEGRWVFVGFSLLSVAR